jgi:cytochrome c551/c552
MRSKIILPGLVLFLTTHLFANPPIEEGKSIFLSRCAACHNVNKVMTGPALAGVNERRSIDWIIKFVQSSQNLVKSGEKDAVGIFEKFNKVPMPDQPDLTAENIKSIVEYIQAESKPATEEKAPFAKPGKKRLFYQPISIRNYGFFTGYFAVVTALILTLYFAVQLKTFERNKRAENISV